MVVIVIVLVVADYTAVFLRWEEFPRESALMKGTGAGTVSRW